MSREYEAKVLDLTPDECRDEIKSWYEDEYRYGRLVDYKRIWDLELTIRTKEKE